MRRKNGEMVGVCGGEEMKDRGRRKIMDRCVAERKWERERDGNSWRREKEWRSHQTLNLSKFHNMRQSFVKST